MDLLQTVRKEGSRGGRSEFKWEDVKQDAQRENYLGHSIMAPVGRWQQGRDLTWYAKGNGESDPRSAAEKLADEKRKIKEAEEDAMLRAMGLPVPDRASTNANLEPLGAKAGEDKAEKEKEGKAGEGEKDRKERKDKERSRRHRDRDGERRRHRSRSRSRDRRDRRRDRSRSRERRDRDENDGRERRRHRSRSREHRRREDRYERRRDRSRSRDRERRRRTRSPHERRD